MAGKRQLQPAAHGHTVDSGHDRLGRCLNRRHGDVQVRFGRGLGRPELADVGTATEHFAGTRDDHGQHRRIGLRFLDAIDDAGAGALAQPIDGRIFQRDDGDAVGDLVGGAHANLTRVGNLKRTIVRIAAFPSKRPCQG